MAEDVQQLAGYISHYVKESISRHRPESRHLPAVLYTLMDYTTQSSASNFIKDVKKGWFIHRGNPRTKCGQRTAKRLSLLLLALGVNEDEEIIFKLKSYYGTDFMYPPDVEKKKIFVDCQAKEMQRLHSKAIRYVDSFGDYVLRTLGFSHDGINSDLETAKSSLKKVKAATEKVLEDRI